MDGETYEYIWERIERKIKKVQSQFSKEICERFHFDLTYGDNTKETIRVQYEKIRDDLKLKCYRSSVHKEDLLDHHKIAACFCKALLQKKIFCFDVNDNTPMAMLRSNYVLAYTASLQIVYYYLADYYREFGPEECYSILLKKKTLEGPPTTVKHDSFHLGRIKTLALNDYYGIELDLLSYSCIMYWIEHYNRQLLENKCCLSALDWSKNGPKEGTSTYQKV